MVDDAITDCATQDLHSDVLTRARRDGEWWLIESEEFFPGPAFYVGVSMENGISTPNDLYEIAGRWAPLAGSEGFHQVYSEETDSLELFLSLIRVPRGRRLGKRGERRAAWLEPAIADPCAPAS